MDRNIKPTDQALDKLLKSLPAEVTAAYLAIRSVIAIISSATGTDSTASYILLFIILLLTVITPFFLKAMDIIVVSIQRYFLAVTFFIWAVNIDYNSMLAIAPLDTGIFFAYGIPILLILWAALALPVYLHKTGG
jgi:hypothetical protein